MRPARSHDSLSAANGSRVTSSDLPNVPPTPGIFESPLNFHKRQSSQPTDAIGSSAYLQQLLRQNGKIFSFELKVKTDNKRFIKPLICRS